MAKLISAQAEALSEKPELLVRLFAAALDRDLRPGVSAIAEHLPEISDESGNVWELHVDVPTLQTTFLSVSRAT